MARLMQGRSGGLTKVGWVEAIDGARSSRSKQLDTEEQASTFKRLVEDNDEAMPSYVVLAEHGLVDFGDPINPRVLLAIREFVSTDWVTPDAKVKYVLQMLEDL